MRIESLRLKNYKSFREAEMNDIPPLAVIVGANGTGKTTTTGKLARVPVEVAAPFLGDDTAQKEIE